MSKSVAKKTFGPVAGEFWASWLWAKKEPACQCRRCKFDPCVWKILWRRKWQPTPVLLPGKFHRQKSLAGYSPWHCKEPDTTEQRSTSHAAWAVLLGSPDLIISRCLAPHSSTLAWKIPWMEEPGRLQSMGFLRVGYDWATSLSLFTFMHWRRKWQPTPVFLPGESQGRWSLVGCHLWGRTESNTTEVS